MATVGVLCARVRVEEKQLMAALAEAGLLPTPLPPVLEPMPIAPPPASLFSESSDTAIIIDRCQDRIIAASVLAAYHAAGTMTVDAGLAATSDRLAVATALAAHQLPRPETRLTCSPEAALDAMAGFGYPGTLVPLLVGTPTVPLLDADVAEAVLEHRFVLGSSRQALALVQAGVPRARLMVIVVAGRAVATIGDGAVPLTTAIALAETAASVLGASFIGIEIAITATDLVIWDVSAVSEFRHARPLGETRVAGAVVAAVMTRLGPRYALEADRVQVAGQAIGDEASWEVSRGEARDGIALSA